MTKENRKKDQCKDTFRAKALNVQKSVCKYALKITELSKLCVFDSYIEINKPNLDKENQESKPSTKSSKEYVKVNVKIYINGKSGGLFYEVKPLILRNLIVQKELKLKPIEQDSAKKNKPLFEVQSITFQTEIPTTDQNGETINSKATAIDANGSEVKSESQELTAKHKKGTVEYRSVINNEATIKFTLRYTKNKSFDTTVRSRAGSTTSVDLLPPGKTFTAKKVDFFSRTTRKEKVSICLGDNNEFYVSTLPRGLTSASSDSSMYNSSDGGNINNHASNSAICDGSFPNKSHSTHSLGLTQNRPPNQHEKVGLPPVPGQSISQHKIKSATMSNLSRFDSAHKSSDFNSRQTSTLPFETAPPSTHTVSAMDISPHNYHANSLGIQKTAIRPSVTISTQLPTPQSIGDLSQSSLDLDNFQELGPKLGAKTNDGPMSPRTSTLLYSTPVKNFQSQPNLNCDYHQYSKPKKIDQGLIQDISAIGHNTDIDHNTNSDTDVIEIEQKLTHTNNHPIPASSSNIHPSIGTIGQTTESEADHQSEKKSVKSLKQDEEKNNEKGKKDKEKKKKPKSSTSIFSASDSEAKTDPSSSGTKRSVSSKKKEAQSVVPKSRNNSSRAVSETEKKKKGNSIGNLNFWNLRSGSESGSKDDSKKLKDKEKAVDESQKTQPLAAPPKPKNYSYDGAEYEVLEASNASSKEKTQVEEQLTTPVTQTSNGISVQPEYLQQEVEKNAMLMSGANKQTEAQHKKTSKTQHHSNATQGNLQKTTKIAELSTLPIIDEQGQHTPLIDPYNKSSASSSIPRRMKSELDVSWSNTRHNRSSSSSMLDIHKGWSSENQNKQDKNRRGESTNRKPATSNLFSPKQFEADNNSNGHSPLSILTGIDKSFESKSQNTEHKNHRFDLTNLQLATSNLFSPNTPEDYKSNDGECSTSTIDGEKTINNPYELKPSHKKQDAKSYNPALLTESQSGNNIGTAKFETNNPVSMQNPISRLDPKGLLKKSDSKGPTIHNNSPAGKTENNLSSGARQGGQSHKQPEVHNTPSNTHTPNDRPSPLRVPTILVDSEEQSRGTYHPMPRPNQSELPNSNARNKKSDTHARQTEPRLTNSKQNSTSKSDVFTLDPQQSIHSSTRSYFSTQDRDLRRKNAFDASYSTSGIKVPNHLQSPQKFDINSSIKHNNDVLNIDSEKTKRNQQNLNYLTQDDESLHSDSDSDNTDIGQESEIYHQINVPMDQECTVVRDIDDNSIVYASEESKEEEEEIQQDITNISTQIENSAQNHPVVTQKKKASRTQLYIGIGSLVISLICCLSLFISDYLIEKIINNGSTEVPTTQFFDMNALTKAFKAIAQCQFDIKSTTVLVTSVISAIALVIGSILVIKFAVQHYNDNKQEKNTPEQQNGASDNNNEKQKTTSGDTTISNDNTKPIEKGSSNNIEMKKVSTNVNKVTACDFQEISLDLG